jgi:geranylgeranylglycerol-phosphate geranylgeranyltransferase
LWARFRLIRPLNVVITIASVWVGAILAVDVRDLGIVVVSLGSLAAGLISAAGYAHNDILDVEIDRINRPERPLPSNTISRRSAYISAIILAALGNLIGAGLGLLPFAITILATLLLYFYNSYLKMTVLWGNITVSLLTALTFIFGGILAGRVMGAVIPAIFSLFLHFSRELVKDMEDRGGDVVRGGVTYAQKYGLRRTADLAVLTLILVMIMVPVPYLAKIYRLSYFLIALIGVEIPLLYSIFKLKRGDFRGLGKISGVLKFSMVMGLMALWAGR